MVSEVGCSPIRGIDDGKIAKPQGSRMRGKITRRHALKGTVNKYNMQWEFAFDRHVKPAFFEGAQFSRCGTRTLRRDHYRSFVLEAVFGECVDGLYGLFVVFAVDEDLS